MSTNLVIRRAVHSALLAGAAALLTPAASTRAQETTDTAARPSETVVVTGSRIRRIENEGALPVQVITQEQIEKTGAVTAEQFLQSVSVAVQGNNNTVAGSGSGATTGGVSGASLRGLGSQRTLVLINGRRVSGGGTITDSTTVDINSIPLAAVERVEVLKDGASAIYGSDAIAGVINFILRKDYQGAEITGFGGGGTDGGGTIKKVNGVLGFGDLAQDRYNVMLVGSFQKEQALYGRDRDFAKSGISLSHLNDVTSGNAFPANASLLSDAFPDVGTFNPNFPNCAPSVVSPVYATIGYQGCRYDPSPYVSLLPDTERYSLYGAFHFALTDHAELYAEASYNHSKQRFIIQPVPISDQFALPDSHPLFNVAPYNGAETIHLSPSSPYYPTAYVQGLTGGATPDLDIFYRSVITGNRDLTDTAEQPRFALGVQGDSAGWNYDVGVLYSESKLSEVVNNGYPNSILLLPILNSGQVNFFGPNTPEVQALADAAQFRGEAYSTKTSITSIAASASRDLFQLPAGALGFAFGGEFRKEKFSTNPSLTIQSGAIDGYGGNFFPIDKSRNVKAAFVEFNIPIVRTLEGGLAVRYDDYQNTGNKTTPKADLRWKPLDELLFRASWGKGFRAPSLTELYQPQVQGVSSTGLSDPLRCVGSNSANPRDCNTQFSTIVGGNPSLKPEESTNVTVGVVFEPNNRMSIGVDGFMVKLKDTIIFGVDPSSILGNLGQFGSLVVRGPADPATPTLADGHIIQINQNNLNFGETKVKGVDVDLRLRFPTDSLGTFAVGMVGTYFATYQAQNIDGTFFSIKGKVSPITNGAGGIIPTWHHYLSVDWLLGAWDFTVSQNYQAGYTDLLATFEDNTVPGFKERDVASYLTHDVQVAYTGFDHLKVAAGARNVLNKEPPYTNAGGQNVFQAGYDPGYVDPRGRFVYGSLTYSFK